MCCWVNRYVLSAMTESQPWWCVWMTQDDIRQGRVILEDTREVYLRESDGSESSVVHVVYADDPDPSVCEYGQQCPVCDGKWPFWYVIFGWMIAIVEVYFRCNGLLKARKARRRVFAWAEREIEVKHRW
jgi:hypothetical protein